nr:NAD/NADP transhydrogenase alpha subunit-like protein [Niveispirillum sp. BGYR6]
MGRPLPVPPPCSASVAAILTAGTPRLIAVPADARLVLFNATQAFWASFGAAATLPTADILDGSAPELNPAARRLEGVTQIGLAAATDAIVNLLFYR